MNNLALFKHTKTTETQTIENLVDPKIIGEIGYDGWELLSGALHQGWIQDAKLYLSRDKGIDAGVPETIKSMMSELYQFKQFFATKGTGANKEALEKLLITGYLLGTDFVSPFRVKQPDGQRKPTGIVPDEHGANQLEGELRRFWAVERGTPKQSEAIGSIKITPLNLKQYCERYGLLEAYDRFAEKLGLKPA